MLVILWIPHGVALTFGVSIERITASIPRPAAAERLLSLGEIGVAFGN
jgi:hypothetical protein